MRARGNGAGEPMETHRGQRRAHSRLLWLMVPLLGAITATVAFAAASDPDWRGTAPVNVSNSAGRAAWQPDIAIASSGQAIVVWSDEGASTRDPFTASNDGGAWSVPEVVSETAHDARFPDLLVVEDQAFVAWAEPPSVAFETEIGGGETRAITAAVALVDYGPRLAAGSNSLHILLSAGAANIPDIYHASRLLTDTVWSEATPAYTSTALFGSWWPALAADQEGQTLHAVWENKGSSVRSIQYISGTVNGVAVQWSSAITLSTGMTHASYPDIAVDFAGNVHVVWTEVGEGIYSDQYVRYTRYNASSSSWMTPTVRIDPVPVKANKDSPSYIAPSIALCPDDEEAVRTCVAWYGFRAGEPEAEDVLLRCSPDGGDSWSSSDTYNVSRTTTQSAWEISMRPSIACDADGLIHAVWQERAGEDPLQEYDIYYTREMHRIHLPLVLRNG